MLLPILTWPFCMPSNALLLLFFHDKMLLIVILDSRPYYLKILNGKFLTLGTASYFLCLVSMAGIRNFAFCFFLRYSVFLLSASLTVQKDERSSPCKLSLSPLLNMISDINECEGITHNCSSNAVCNNTKGSYNCTCKPGYLGDGWNCTGDEYTNA